MRVLHIGKFYPPARGGMETVVQSLCEGERAFIDSRALVVNTERQTIQETWRGVPVTRVASYGAAGSVPVCPGLAFWLRKTTADVLVLHEPHPVALVAHFVARPSARLFVWFHSEVVRPAWRYRTMYRPFLKRVLDRAERVIVASPRMAEHAEQLRHHRGKCTVIPYGIDASRYACTDDVAARAAEIRRQHGENLVLFVGRMVPYKGVDVLLQALRGTEVTAILVGDGPQRPALEGFAAATGLGGRAVFAGNVSDAELLALYHACDLFVLPSVTRAEAFGMVQLEAMACGKPVISTDLPSGVPWVNRHGETGLIVPPSDPVALRDAISRLLANPDVARHMGRHGRERVVSEFTIERMIQRTVALYGARLPVGVGL
jgi:glycosyltransferase involved in cell wall biosynthesis